MTGRVYKPLQGIRVLSFEIAFALPAGTRTLADLGADVVRVARPGGNKFGRYVSVSDGCFLGKPSVAIDLTQADGRQLAFDLALQADVVSNNFRPGVLDKYGLGASALREAKPSLIWLQLSGYGTPGPWSHFPAYGPSTEAAGGLNRLMSDEGEVPFRTGSGVFSDQLAGRYAALALTSALDKRRQTGKGSTIDLAMTAGITHMLGPLMTEALRTQQMPANHRNRSDRYAPQGVYRCRGNDEWIAITVKNDAAWKALVELVDGDLDKTLSLAARRRDHDTIDAVIEAWTAGQDKDELASLLQSRGIAAGPVRTVQDSALDPQMKARKTLQMVRHASPLLGYAAHPHPGLPWRVVNRERVKVTDYRNNGQDNIGVLSRWLGLDQAGIDELTGRGVLMDDGPVEISTRQASGDLYDPDFARKLELPQ